jgi:hypothetical protein
MVFVSGKPDIYLVYHGFSFPEKILWIFQKERKRWETSRKNQKRKAASGPQAFPDPSPASPVKKRYPQSFDASAGTSHFLIICFLQPVLTEHHCV